jgi:hypothetical protein
MKITRLEFLKLATLVPVAIFTKGDRSMPEEYQMKESKLEEDIRLYIVYPFDDGLQYSVRVNQMLDANKKPPVWMKPIMEISGIRMDSPNMLRQLLRGVDKILRQWKIWNKDTGKPANVS